MTINLEILNLHKIFNEGESNEVYALKNISLSFYSGELVLFIGHNGSGKSTLLNIIDGRLEQSSGDIKIDGKIINTLEVFQRAKYIYRIFQNTLNCVIQMASIRENMAFSLMRNSKFSAYSNLVKKGHDEQFKSIIMKYNKVLANNLDKKIFTLSPGERQAIVLSLLDIQKDTEPQILLADEPTAALDPEMVVKFFSAIKDLSKKGWLCIVVTHDERLINNKLIDRIINFDEGEIK